MNTHDLVAFVAVVETGSIVAASARLNLTQPGVTRRIQNLEELLGTQLLDRLSKPLKPTSAGHAAYEHGRRDPTYDTLRKLVEAAGERLQLDAASPRSDLPRSDLPPSADAHEHARRLLDVLSLADAIPARRRNPVLSAPRLIST